MIRSRWRITLRVRIAAAIFIVATAPLVLVFFWSQFDKNVPGQKWTNVRDAMDQAADLVAQNVLTGPDVSDAFGDIAGRNRVRLRVFKNDETLVDVDADAPADASRPIERFFLGAISDDSARDIDATFGPIETRPEVRAAEKHGKAWVGCEFHTLLFCQAVRIEKHDHGRYIVLAQATSQRAVEPIYRLRRQLLRLGLLTLPLSAILAFYAARLVTASLERLRAQAVAHARTGTGRLAHERRDEVGDLASAFNALLDTLEKKRLDTEHFVADLVHELKNPVAAVRACAEQLGGSRVIDAERAERYARVLGDSSAKLDRVVSQFLELARAEAGMPNEERGRVDVVELVNALTSSLLADVRSEGKVIRFAAATPDAHAVVLGVSNRLEAVFRELLDNALTFAGDAGTIDVSVETRASTVRVTVADSGPGITERDLPRVFDRFFTTRGRARGTGLGLALVKAVAEAHGGAVSVVSAGEGAGSAFSVELPLAP